MPAIGAGKLTLLELVIESVCVRRRLRATDRFDIGVGEVLDAEYLAVALFEAAIFYG
jgi:hypothetical protein